MPKGMMLAAGRGTRLGALTENLPKPLLPVANRPVMSQGIHCLHNLGITEICTNVSYLGRKIMDTFGDGSAFGVTIYWSPEQEPTGTAGGMKRMQHVLGDDTVVVIAGDAMLDIDLTSLLDYHRTNRAFATLATIPVADASQYGVVVTDAAGRIVRFQEKPAPGTEISRQANTGIYIFEPAIFDLIPAGEFSDFALHVFPEILRRALPFFALPVKGYWTDIGNPGDYLQANLDYLAGEVHVDGHGQRIDGNLIAPTAHAAQTRLRNCIIGDNARLAVGVELTNCVVWPGATLAEPVRLDSAVITPWGIYRIEGKTAQPLEPVASV